MESWKGGASCTKTKGLKAPAENGSTVNNLDRFVSEVSRPLGTALGFTVNYGTNPPECDSGGDPDANGADLVAYANLQKHYGIKYWEIGNELYNGGGSETDFHPKPGDGASYGDYELAFYDAMKEKDSSILIGIPVADIVYSWIADWTLPAMQAAKYDAVVFHNYPMRDPITDGQTLYPERVASNVGRITRPAARTGNGIAQCQEEPRRYLDYGMERRCGRRPLVTSKHGCGDADIYDHATSRIYAGGRAAMPHGGRKGRAMYA